MAGPLPRVVDPALPELPTWTRRARLGRKGCQPDVAATLGHAREAGLKVAIVTNGQTWAQRAKIEAASLTELGDACCISEAEGYWKPAPELLRMAAERCVESLDGAWMIGGKPVTDIGGAAALWGQDDMDAPWAHLAQPSRLRPNRAGGQLLGRRPDCPRATGRG